MKGSTSAPRSATKRVGLFLGDADALVAQRRLTAALRGGPADVLAIAAATIWLFRLRMFVLEVFDEAL
jgi:hypothetical protein